VSLCEEKTDMRQVFLLRYGTRILCRLGLHRWQVTDWAYVRGRKAIATCVCRWCGAVRREWMPDGRRLRGGVMR